MGYDNNNWLRETAERQAAQLGGQPLFPPPPATHKTFLLDSDGRFASTRRLVTLKAPKRTIWERIKRFLLPMEMRKPSDRD